MLMETLFGADGLSQLKGSVVECAKCFQLPLIRLVLLIFEQLDIEVDILDSCS